MTAAPLAVDNKVITGVAGGEYGIRGFIDAYDAKSGQRLWRFYTIPGPGEPGHDTWPGDSWKHGGGPAWLTGSYDPQLKLVYWGVGNPGPNYGTSGRQGANLFTNCVVALDAETGRLKWYFQFTPNDSHDWDAVQIPVLADLDMPAGRKRLLLWANRNAFYYVLDRENGTFLSATPFAKQTWAERIDSNGHPIVNPLSNPTEKGSVVYPDSSGATNWWSPSFSPHTGLFYIPAQDIEAVFFRSKATFTAGDPFTGSTKQWTDPKSARAFIRAIEAKTGTTKWTYDYEPFCKVNGLMSTAGDVVISTCGQRLTILDAYTGHELRTFNLGGSIHAAPISFAIDGDQYLTASAGRDIFTFRLVAPRTEPRKTAAFLPGK